ncbi:MAG: hypothetical protein PHP50_06985 [Lachnospiraceae bacterium]|nr:hypothetical protein [Lachnospiraceae bacterium]
MKCEDGYFTIEATLLMPVIIMVILFLYYVSFYLYDCCLLSQDAYLVVLEGGRNMYDDTETATQKAQSMINQQYFDKYMSWKANKNELYVDDKNITVIQSGQVRVPMFSKHFWKFERQNFFIKVKREGKRRDPVTFIRNCRKVMKLLE